MYEARSFSMAIFLVGRGLMPISARTDEATHRPAFSFADDAKQHVDDFHHATDLLEAFGAMVAEKPSRKGGAR
jgi:hypothetical protein